MMHIPIAAFRDPVQSILQDAQDIGFYLTELGFPMQWGLSTETWRKKIHRREYKERLITYFHSAVVINEEER
jgi:hypothetical protein